MQLKQAISLMLSTATGSPSFRHGILRPTESVNQKYQRLGIATFDN